MPVELTEAHLTDAQRRVVEHHHGPLRVRGGAGSGKTTALVHRYLRLAAEAGAHAVLVLARDRAAAVRFRSAVLPRLGGGFEPLSITTAWGVAHHLLRRHGRRPPVLISDERSTLVRQLLAAEAGDRGRWPSLHHLVGRRAFAEQAVDALASALAAGLGPGELREAAATGEAGCRWRELAGFMERYHAVLSARGLVDGPGVLAEARSLLADPRLAADQHRRHPHVLVDDYEAATPAIGQLLDLLVGPEGQLAVAANPALAVGSPAGATSACFEALGGPPLGPVTDVVLDTAFRRPAQPSVVRCRHPSTEAEAVAGELRAARRRGVAWDQMAVLVRGLEPRRRAVTRALARHDIPVAAVRGRVHDEPAVRGLVDMLRWVDGDHSAVERLMGSPLADLDPGQVRSMRREAARTGEPLERQAPLAHLASVRDALAVRARTDDVAVVAHEAFRQCCSHLVPEPAHRPLAFEDRALDAVVSFLDEVSRHVERHPGTSVGRYLSHLDSAHHPDPWLSSPPPPGTVTVSSVAAAAGQEWDTVVVAGCVEGELPRLGHGLAFFDTAVLGGAPLPSVSERRAAALAEERRLFSLACSRATGTLVATAAPEPGVLLSRFVEGWPERPPLLELEASHVPTALPPTAGTLPVWPTGGLSLSATQLDTYEDCPLKHAYRYALGVRSPSGVHANLGSLVHQVLHRFCDPNGPVPPDERTLERLHRLAEDSWRDDLAPYRPQLEEARRDLFDMLDLWWEREGGVGTGPAVVATEHRFDVEVGPHNLTGRIDRVDVSDDGAGLRVVDYKTGKSKPKPVDVAEDLQLATYHLGASRDTQLTAVGPVRQLRLLHLRTMTAFEQEVLPGHEAATEARILAAADRMASEDFHPAIDANCDHCEFHRLCPLWPVGREVGQE